LKKAAGAGTVYWRRGYASTGCQGRQTTTCDCYGIRFRGDSAVHNFLTVGGASTGWSEMMFVFKKKIPNCEALKECYEKGVESKEHVRELKKDPFSILNFCDAFFAE
jgi:hypothetical protein